MKELACLDSVWWKSSYWLAAVLVACATTKCGWHAMTWWRLMCVSLCKMYLLTVSKWESISFLVSCLPFLVESAEVTNQDILCGTLHPLSTPFNCVKTSPFQINIQFDQCYCWKLSIYKMNYKESQFPSSCKCDTGSSFSLKGLIVNLSYHFISGHWASYGQTRL